MTLASHGPHLGASSVEGAVAALRAGGLRASAARRLVLEALFAAGGPVSAEELAEGLGGRLPRSDVASTYRNLETLEELGLVRHVHLGHSPGRYVLAGAPEQEYGACETLRLVRRRRRARPRAGPRARARGVRLRGPFQPFPDRGAVRVVRRGRTAARGRPRRRDLT